MEQEVVEEKLKFQLRFLVMPDFIYSDNRLSALEIKVYSFIHSYKQPRFYFSNDQLAVMFNVSSQGVSNAITKLKAYQYISTEYKIKADGGKIRFIQDLYSDYNSSYSPTNTAVIDNVNKLKGIVTNKLVTRAKPEFGNSEVNLVLQEFKKRIGSIPIDQKPNQVAWNITQLINSFIKKNNYAYTQKNGSSLSFNYMLNQIWVWYMKHDFAPDTKRLATFKQHLKVFLDKAGEKI
jgi:hypothetical protein